MRTYSNENDFDLHENRRESETHFHMNGFARRLVLRQRVTRKRPIKGKTYPRRFASSSSVFLETSIFSLLTFT